MDLSHYPSPLRTNGHTLVHAPARSSALTPNSASTTTTGNFPSPQSATGHTRHVSQNSGRVHLAEDEDDDENMASPVNGDGPLRKKQKRNKPTLSCHECVERKTKVSSISIIPKAQEGLRDAAQYP